METGISIRVTYWSEQTGNTSIDDFEGIDEFRDELAENYASFVKGRPGDLGGINELLIEIFSNVPFAEVAKFLAEGIAFDLIKSGTKSFVLKPFLTAYKKLKEKNESKGIDIETLRIAFQDSEVIVYKIEHDSIYSHLEKTLTMIADNYPRFELASGELPVEIHVPVFEDDSEDRFARYRVQLDVDETIENISASDYFNLWGLKYDFARSSRVYDVSRKLLIDDEFLTKEEYDSMWQLRNKETR
jgi:hypothetical protein